MLSRALILSFISLGLTACDILNSGYKYKETENKIKGKEISVTSEFKNNEKTLLSQVTLLCQPASKQLSIRMLSTEAKADSNGNLTAAAIVDLEGMKSIPSGKFKAEMFEVADFSDMVGLSKTTYSNEIIWNPSLDRVWGQYLLATRDVNAAALDPQDRERISEFERAAEELPKLEISAEAIRKLASGKASSLADDIEKQNVMSRAEEEIAALGIQSKKSFIELTLKQIEPLKAKFNLLIAADAKREKSLENLLKAIGTSYTLMGKDDKAKAIEKLLLIKDSDNFDLESVATLAMLDLRGIGNNKNGNSDIGDLLIFLQEGLGKVEKTKSIYNAGTMAKDDVSYLSTFGKDLTFSYKTTKGEMMFSFDLMNKSTQKVIEACK